jgi:hypothetical protein
MVFPMRWLATGRLEMENGPLQVAYGPFRIKRVDVLELANPEVS